MTVTYSTDVYMFKHLTPEEVVEYQEYARVNDPENMQSWAIYHPVCRAVWSARGLIPRDHEEVGQ